MIVSVLIYIKLLNDPFFHFISIWLKLEGMYGPSLYKGSVRFVNPAVLGQNLMGAYSTCTEPDPIKNYVIDFYSMLESTSQISHVTYFSFTDWALNSVESKSTLKFFIGSGHVANVINSDSQNFPLFLKSLKTCQI